MFSTPNVALVPREIGFRGNKNNQGRLAKTSSHLPQKAKKAWE